MQAISDLEYQGKVMEVEPITMTLQEVAEQIKIGNPVVAELEPGDNTYYAILIVPLHGDGIRSKLGRFGIVPARSGDYWFVAKLGSIQSQGTFVRVDVAAIQVHQVAPLTDNEWSQRLLSWWLTHLVRAVTE